MSLTRPYGSWPSPVTAASVAAQSLRLSAVSIDGDKGTDSITNPNQLIFVPPLPPGTDPFEGFEIVLP